MTEYLDIRCGDDIDEFARDIPPLETLAQDLYHWLITERGSLIDAPDWGFGLLSYLGRPLPLTLASDIENGIREDDRVSDAQCTIIQLDVEAEQYKLVLIVAVDADFLTIALQFSPSGIVRVA